MVHGRVQARSRAKHEASMPNRLSRAWRCLNAHGMEWSAWLQCPRDGVEYGGTHIGGSAVGGGAQARDRVERCDAWSSACKGQREQSVEWAEQNIEQPKYRGGAEKEPQCLDGEAEHKGAQAGVKQSAKESQCPRGAMECVGISTLEDGVEHGVE